LPRIPVALLQVNRQGIPQSKARVSGGLKKYAFIDALRGYAILGVLMVHSAQFVAPRHALLRTLMAGGGRGVQLFYIASALTLCLSWRFRCAQETHTARNFYIRRFFRIAPMFYIGIVLYSLLNGTAASYWAPNGIKWWFVLLTALFLHGFHPETMDSVVPGGWSIAVEMTFYAILPLLMKYVKSIPSSVAFLALSLVLCKLSAVIYYDIFAGYYPADQQYLVSSFLFQNFFGQLPVFAIGLLACFVFENEGGLKRRVIIFDGVFGLIVLLQLAVLLRLHVNFLSNYVVFSGIFALGALNMAVFPTALLVNGFIAFIGEISFSMYLIHFAVIHFLSRIGFTALFKPGDLSSLGYYLCVVGVSIVASRILYATVETRGIALGKHIIKRLHASDGADGGKQLAHTRYARELE
jgi:peptidoglycan/LPS O-acetylase OafA/YrhL